MILFTEFKYLIEPVYYNIRAEDIQNSIISDERNIFSFEMTKCFIEFRRAQQSPE